MERDGTSLFISDEELGEQSREVSVLFHYNIADEEGTVEFSLAPKLENN